LYIDFRTTPNQDVLILKAQLEKIIHDSQLEGTVDLYSYRRGYEAVNIDRLAQVLERAHRRIFNKPLEKIVGPECSMWRDINVFNEAGIPSATYGPGAGGGGGNLYLTIDEMLKASQIYALVAIHLCSQEKPSSGHIR
jgi:acetylornithine deacetylase/succinyl-diaminopimelate desuccinylase-like protein